MALRVTLECGHISTLRTRTTTEGYTHDWQLFLRGIDNAEIHHYIEKVVFNLHESFPKPRRVFTEPPFVLKESGYAGFDIPIHIHLKNKQRFDIVYDLQLQPSGPPINRVVHHEKIINNPTDDFRRKLLRGGAVVIPNTDSRNDKGESKSSPMVGKPKLNGSESKKHRIIDPKPSNSFADLFGPPIKTSKISPDSKKSSQGDKSSIIKPPSTDRSEKTDKSVKSKDSPHKDVKKEKSDEKKDKKIKDAAKDKIRSKEKSKQSFSPGHKSHSSPVSKRPLSPVIMKKPASTSPPPSRRRSLSPKYKEKEIKKLTQDKDKDKEKEKEREREKEKEKDRLKESSKNSIDLLKGEKKKDKKKHKEERDKDRKEKYRESERSGSSKESVKTSDKKIDKPEKTEKEKDKVQDHKTTKDGRKSPKLLKEIEKPKEPIKTEKSDKVEKDKTKDSKTDKEKQKHKHKKDKHKRDKRDSSKEREKKDKREKSKSTEKQSTQPASTTNPLSTLLSEMPERDSSDSAPSIDDDSFSEPKNITIKKDSEVAPSTNIDTKPLSPIVSQSDLKKEKSERNKRDKIKNEDKESRRKKRKSDSKVDDELVTKRGKIRDDSVSPLLEPVSSSQSPVAIDIDASANQSRVKDERIEHDELIDTVENEQVAPDSTNNTLTESETSEPPVFSDDYVSQLKELQQKIMTLQDNQELQRVVQVIAETGQYEITKKTFDFDLCALDRRTVQRLQQFFSAS